MFKKKHPQKKNRNSDKTSAANMYGDTIRHDASAQRVNVSMESYDEAAVVAEFCANIAELTEYRLMGTTKPDEVVGLCPEYFALYGNQNKLPLLRDATEKAIKAVCDALVLNKDGTKTATLPYFTNEHDPLINPKLSPMVLCRPRTTDGVGVFSGVSLLDDCAKCQKHTPHQAVDPFLTLHKQYDGIIEIFVPLIHGSNPIINTLKLAPEGQKGHQWVASRLNPTLSPMWDEHASVDFAVAKQKTWDCDQGQMLFVNVGLPHAYTPLVLQAQGHAVDFWVKLTVPHPSGPSDCCLSYEPFALQAAKYNWTWLASAYLMTRAMTKQRKRSRSSSVEVPP